MKKLIMLTLLVLCASFAQAQESAKAGPFKSGAHRKQAENKLPNGWHLAKSTDGPFSVEMPGPFTDMTVVADGEALHLLVSSDTSGSTYMAMLERTGERGNVGKKFDADLRAAGSEATTFRGFPALTKRAPLPDKSAIASSLRFRTPEGVYVLSIIYAVKEDAATAASEKHYLDSLEIR